jgi:ATP-binding cassette subfamily B protein
MRLWGFIDINRRRQFLLLLILMVATSCAEIMSIGAVLPFLGALTAPDRVFEMAFTQPFIRSLKIVEPNQLLLPLTIAFGFATILAGAMRVLLLWASTRLAFATGADLSISIYRHTLYQPYATHCARNSSEVIDGISGKSNGVIYNVIVPTLTLISSGIIILMIFVAMLALEPVVALAAFGGFGAIYIAIVRLTRKQLLADSKIVARESTSVIKALQEGLGGIRDVLIDGTQETYCRIYRNADAPLRHAQGNNSFIGGCPRFIMEALGMLLIATLAYFLSQQADGIASAIPILGALALGAQRLLPVLQQAYGSWVQINGAQVSLLDTLKLLEQPMPDYANKQMSPVPFKKSITLKQLGFRYDDQAPYALKDINLTIKKGSRVGFIGTTGSGKSTLLDVVMSLLKPTEGMLEIDDELITLNNHRAWQTRIAHVPQSIFLADSTIEENIAFGVPKDKIDHLRVRQAAKQAQISDSIESWPEKYKTYVGERGVRLSGGQRQRIGIARALYKKADVIIFDEATSALDSETEQAVINAIDGLSKHLTLIIIAHRITTLKSCERIIELSRGGIKRIVSYQDIVNK